MMCFVQEMTKQFVVVNETICTLQIAVVSRKSEEEFCIEYI